MAWNPGWDGQWGCGPDQNEDGAHAAWAGQWFQRSSWKPQGPLEGDPKLVLSSGALRASWQLARAHHTCSSLCLASELRIIKT